MKLYLNFNTFLVRSPLWLVRLTGEFNWLLVTESVDYRSDVLRGAVVVGPGIPPRSLVRDTLAENDGSNEIAYRQPGMTRVVQAAGRVARGPTDRGAVVMIDPRFTESAYQKYFPHHWRSRPVMSNAIGSALANFWSS